MSPFVGYPQTLERILHEIQHILLTAAAVLFCTASMTGQSSHTWVSATGKDNSACTQEKPCATFQGALVKTDAGGMISVASPGDFGPVIIAKSVTIDGSNIGSIATSAAQAISIQLFTGGSVTIRNLTINGLGSSGQNGIVFTGTGYLTVENCRIESFSGNGINAFSQGQENVVVRNTTISDVGVGVVNAGTGPVGSFCKMWPSRAPQVQLSTPKTAVSLKSPTPLSRKVQ